MPGNTCDYPGCTLPIVLRCDRCGKSYCVRHGPSLGAGTCPSCIRRLDEEYNAQFSRANRQMGRGCLIGIAFFAVFAILAYAYDPVSLQLIKVPFVFDAILATGMAIGLSIFLQGLFSRP